MAKQSEVYSFSASSAADKELVERVKALYVKQGRKFSWVVLQALKEFEAKERIRNEKN